MVDLSLPYLRQRQGLANGGSHEVALGRARTYLNSAKKKKRVVLMLITTHAWATGHGRQKRGHWALCRQTWPSHQSTSLTRPWSEPKMQFLKQTMSNKNLWLLSDQLFVGLPRGRRFKDNNKCRSLGHAKGWLASSLIWSSLYLSLKNIQILIKLLSTQFTIKLILKGIFKGTINSRYRVTNWAV